MRTKRVISLLVMVLSLYAGGVFGSVPVPVSPGNGNGVAIISQECPTFSWSQVEGVVSYKVKIYERVNGEIFSYEEMERTGEPVMSVEIKAPALSWTPSAGECLGTGKRYVWYVGAISGAKRPEAAEGSHPELVEGWSEGRGFEVEVGASVAMKEVLKETVKEYLIKEWKETESYREVKERIKAEMVKEMKGGGAVVMGSGTPDMAAFEGTSNTLFGSGAGNSLGDDDDSATFIGYRAGYNSADGASGDGKYNTFVGCQSGYSNTTGESNAFLGHNVGFLNTTGYNNTFLGRSAGFGNTTGNYNTFLGRSAGYQNSTGSLNVFLGYYAGYNEMGSNRLYIDNWGTDSPLIYGEFDNNLVVINGVLSVASSKEYKENINHLRIDTAMETLQNLYPVEFSYKVTPSERHTGFISEEVPESLTTRDRKAVNPMDILAVLTKVVQEQQKTISTLREELNELKGKMR